MLKWSLNKGQRWLHLSQFIPLFPKDWNACLQTQVSGAVKSAGSQPSYWCWMPLAPVRVSRMQTFWAFWKVTWFSPQHTDGVLSLKAREDVSQPQNEPGCGWHWRRLPCRFFSDPWRPLCASCVGRKPLGREGAIGCWASLPLRSSQSSFSGSNASVPFSRL